MPKSISHVSVTKKWTPEELLDIFVKEGNFTKSACNFENSEIRTYKAGIYKGIEFPGVHPFVNRIDIALGNSLAVFMEFGPNAGMYKFLNYFFLFGALASRKGKKANKVILDYIRTETERLMKNRS